MYDGFLLCRAVDKKEPTVALCFRLSCKVESQAISLCVCVCVQLVEGTGLDASLVSPPTSFLKDL
jgi:hypothetical protein